MMEPNRPKLSRRTTLRWMAAASVAMPLTPHALTNANALAVSKERPMGYGRDPDLMHPIVPWARTMTSSQLQVTSEVADFILPATESAPAPSALGIADFIDEWVSAPYPEQLADRDVIFSGLEWIDSEASRRWLCRFLKLSRAQREEIMMTMGSTHTLAGSAQNSFFGRVRTLVVGGYYTTPEGFKDIGYLGNTALTTYPSITDRERVILENELRKLGISSLAAPNSN